MAGFREFQTGEVLTAANVDDFLMKQSVQKYADAAARDAALGTAVASGNALREGMVAYLDDTDEVIKYDGTDWSSVGEASGLVAVKHALFTGTQSASVTTGASLAITDLSITHTLADAANKLVISAYVGIGTNPQARDCGLAIADDGTLIGIGAADGNRTQVGSLNMVNGTGGNIISLSPSVTFVYEPGDTDEHTYTARAVNVDTTTQTLTINRSAINSNTAFYPAASSSLVIMEVRV
jgi:hypothetical protein